MANTIKVIDLINKIANGEEVPERVKFDKTIFMYNKERIDYIHDFDDWASETLLFRVMNTHFISDLLEAKVEIIEEQQDIDIQEIEELPKILFLGTGKNDLTKVLNDIIDNQNQQLQAVKQLDRNIKDKE